MKIQLHSCVLMLSLFLPGIALATTTYTITDLGDGTASEINASGQVLGFSATVGQSYIYSSSAKTFNYIGTNPARGINDLGQVCGNSGTDVTFYNGTWHDLGTPLGGGTPCKAYNLNNAGEITGQVAISPGLIHGFVYNPLNPNNGGYTDLGTLSGNPSDTCYGFSINTQGQIEGDSTASNGNTHAYIWTNGTMADLGTFGGPDSSGIHVNNLSHATGTAQTPASGTTPATWVSHIFFWNGTSLTDCGTLPGDNYANAGGMNNYDTIVGYSIPNATSAGGLSRAVIYSNGSLTNLNSLIPANSGFDLLSGDGINDSGMIVVDALDAGGTEHALLLTPVPEPGTIGLLVYSSTILLWRRRRIAR